MIYNLWSSITLKVFSQDALEGTINEHIIYEPVYLPFLDLQSKDTGLILRQLFSLCFTKFYVHYFVIKKDLYFQK